MTVVHREMFRREKPYKLVKTKQAEKRKGLISSINETRHVTAVFLSFHLGCLKYMHIPLADDGHVLRALLIQLPQPGATVVDTNDSQSHCEFQYQFASECT